MKTGQRLLTATVDHIARTDPAKICFSIPFKSSTSDYIDITYQRFANSIDRLAWHLKQSIGLSDDLETICYLGPPDLFYFIFALAACKCGFKVSGSSTLRRSSSKLTVMSRHCLHHHGTALKPISTFSRPQIAADCLVLRQPRQRPSYRSTK